MTLIVCADHRALEDPITSLILMISLLGCKEEPAKVVPGGARPVLHRLTEPQLNLALQDLFPDVDVPFVDVPQDIAVNGFDNNALTRDATPFLVESLQRDLTAVTAAATDSAVLLQCAPGGGDDPQGCGRASLEKILQRAWRRPATADEVQWIQGLFDGWYGEVGFEHALQLSLLVILQSPDFLYLVERGSDVRIAGGTRRLSDWEIASRLSFFLWNTMPDEALFAAAQRGELSDPETVREQARRMLQDARGRAAVMEFSKQWLGYSYIQEIDPDPEMFFSEFADDDDGVGGNVAYLRGTFQAEFELFVESTLFGQGTLDALLTSRQGYVSPASAQLYGVDIDAARNGDTEEIFYVANATLNEGVYVEMTPVQLPSDQRAGILTQGAFLAGHSHARQPSPVLRGVFLRDRLLCEPPLLPPDDIPPLEDDETHSDWTTNRERFAAHTNNPACSGCHIAIDGAGFPFENYDALGAWRDTDNGAPVDASGQLVGTDVDIPVQDAIELIEALAGSRRVYDCAVTNIYRYGMHRTETDQDNDAITALQQNFWNNGGVIPELLVDFVSSNAFLTMPDNGSSR
ncbi:MAG: DUF1592 domain-containing protein [Myxococcota bacterium]